MQHNLFEGEMAKTVALVAGCLIGWSCRYHGEDTPARRKILERMTQEAEWEIYPVCPEMLAGMPVPRPPARRKGFGLYQGDKEVTADFERAAELTLKLAKGVGATKFYGLKDSPSCCPKNGLTCKLLEKNGITCHYG